MKSLTVIVLFLVLSTTLALRIGHEQTLPSNPSSSNGTSTNSSTNTTKPASNTTSPTNPTSPTPTPTPTPTSNSTSTNTSSTSNQTISSNSSGSKTPTTPSSPSNSTSGGQTAPAASDDLTPDEKKEYDAWKSNLIPWAKFENGEDKSTFFNSQVDSNFGLAKKNEIKGRRHK